MSDRVINAEEENKRDKVNKDLLYLHVAVKSVVNNLLFPNIHKWTFEEAEKSWTHIYK